MTTFQRLSWHQGPSRANTGDLLRCSGVEERGQATDGPSSSDSSVSVPVSDHPTASARAAGHAAPHEGLPARRAVAWTSAVTVSTSSSGRGPRAVVCPCRERVTEPIELDRRAQEVDDLGVVRRDLSAVDRRPQLGSALLEHLAERMEGGLRASHLLQQLAHTNRLSLRVPHQRRPQAPVADPRPLREVDDVGQLDRLDLRRHEPSVGVGVGSRTRVASAGWQPAGGVRPRPRALPPRRLGRRRLRRHSSPRSPAPRRGGARPALRSRPGGRPWRAPCQQVSAPARTALLLASAVVQSSSVRSGPRRTDWPAASISSARSDACSVHGGADRERHQRRNPTSPATTSTSTSHHQLLASSSESVRSWGRLPRRRWSWPRWSSWWARSWSWPGRWWWSSRASVVVVVTGGRVVVVIGARVVVGRLGGRGARPGRAGVGGGRRSG